MISTIRFLKTNRYRREIGSTDTVLGYGIHDALVRRGIAEFVAAPQSVSAVEVPEVESIPKTSRAAKRRSFEET